MQCRPQLLPAKCRSMIELWMEREREKMRGNGFSLVEALEDKTADLRKTLKWGVWSSPEQLDSDSRDYLACICRTKWNRLTGRYTINLSYAWWTCHRANLSKLTETRSQASWVGDDSGPWWGDHEAVGAHTWSPGSSHWPVTMSQLPRATGDNNGD